MARILFVNTPTYIGGAEISLLTLMRHLPANRYEPYLLTSGAGPLMDEAQNLNIPLFTQEFPWFSRRRPWRYLSSIWQLAGIAKRCGIDLIHTNCDHSLRYTMYACRMLNIPYVCHVRDFVRGWFQPRQVAVLNQAAQVIANSNAVAEACIQAGTNPDKVITVYNPIDTTAFVQAASDSFQLRSELAIPAEALVIGIVGQIQSIKGHDYFVQAAVHLAAQLPNVHFLIVGAAPPNAEAQAFETKLRSIVAESGYSSRFHFAGYRKDVAPAFKSIDILAVPSIAEPFGRVAVEGMAAGCAVVGTDVGGLPEIITNEIDGVLVPPRDPSQLLDALNRLAMDSALRHKLAQSGQISAQRFTVTHHVEQIQTLYDAILAIEPSRS